jgi:hypothetical protein
MVREARRQRRLVDGRLTDWIVVRNRLSQLGSRNKKLVGEGINELSRRMGFRCIDGFAERVVYREFFPRGLTALDNLDETTLGTRPNMSHVTAREEVIALLNALHLPLSENGRRRAAARAEWYSVMDQPLLVHDVLACVVPPFVPAKAGTHFISERIAPGPPLARARTEIMSLASGSVIRCKIAHVQGPRPDTCADGEARRDRRLSREGKVARARLVGARRTRAADLRARRHDEPAANLGHSLRVAGRHVPRGGRSRRPRHPARLFPRFE